MFNLELRLMVRLHASEFLSTLMYKDEGFDILRVKSKVISGKQRSTNDMPSMRCSLNSNLPDGVGIHYRDGNGDRGLGLRGLRWLTRRSNYDRKKRERCMFSSPGHTPYLPYKISSSVHSQTHRSRNSILRPWSFIAPCLG